ncbi:hypothetical protein D770_13355 [Flammeovirgaceae bacterium 311]|nr:hypothetical protein D770_13355 [Flammeovirgaceae bacterium 311]
MYKILFIDEQKEDIDNFKDYVEEKDLQGEFIVESLLPMENEDEMIEMVFSLKADAIVTDFMLNEYKDSIDFNVPYNGATLVQKILSEREEFPCFVMTSFDDQAVGQSEDVNLVYIKGILHGSEKDTKAKANFLDRVKSQITHYRAKVERAEARLLFLIDEAQKRRLDAQEEEELISLDSFIEKALDKTSAVPKVSKKESELSHLAELLAKVDALTVKLDNKNG